MFLRGRFLQRSIDDERPQSLAETELGLITQRHSVSGLRYTLIIFVFLEISCFNTHCSYSLLSCDFELGKGSVSEEKAISWLMQVQDLVVMILITMTSR